MPNRYRLVLLAATLGIAGGLGAALLHGSHAPAAEPEVQPLRAQATWAAGTKRAPDFALRDQNGAGVSLRTLRGRTVLLTFLDSVCTRACPVEGRAIADIQRKLDVPASTVVVSVDPWSDTPRTAKAFARKSHWNGRWYWLLGSAKRLRPIWHAYSIGVVRTPGDITHSVALYLIDGKGYLRAAYLFPFSTNTVVHDVRAVS